MDDPTLTIDRDPTATLHVLAETNTNDRSEALTLIVETAAATNLVSLDDNDARRLRDAITQWIAAGRPEAARRLHEGCPDCLHERIVVTRECPNQGCKQWITYDLFDAMEGRGNYECPHCNVPIIYVVRDGASYIEVNIEALEARSHTPPPWASLLPKR